MGFLAIGIPTALVLAFPEGYGAVGFYAGLGVGTMVALVGCAFRIATVFRTMERVT